LQLLDLAAAFENFEKELSGKGLARCLSVYPVRFQPLPIG